MRLTKAREGWLVGALAGAIVAAGCGTSKPETPKGAAAEQPPPVQAATAAPSSDAIEIQTVLSVEREVDVLAQRDGVVEEILHDQGARVEKGASLARLDDRQLQAELDKARADLEVARNNVKYNEEEVKARQAAYRRAQEMFKEGLNSQADLEEAEFRAKGAQYDLEGWRATVTRTEAEIRLLELELEKIQIRAPFGGVVARRYIRPGQNVAKEDKCFRLSQLAPLQVHFLVPETASRRPKVGDVVTVAPLSDTHRVYVARVQKVGPTVDAASGSYDVTAVLTGSDLEELRPGMSVKVIWGAAAAGPR